MPELIIYQTPQDYYNATIDYLNANQVRNNLIIGLLNAIQNKMELIPTAVFLNVLHANNIVFTAVYNGPKILISGVTSNPLAISLAAHFFKKEGIQAFGVVGPEFLAKHFAMEYSSPHPNPRVQFLYQLNNLIPFNIDLEPFLPATLDDVDWITDWSYRFLIDAHMSPLPKPESLQQLTQQRIQQGMFYKWVIQNEPVAISATIRKTKDVAIVGYVFTPQNFRGKGYAFSIVYRLSQLMLASGFKQCALFAEEINPVSNYIYKKMGYQYVETFNDIVF